MCHCRRTTVPEWLSPTCVGARGEGGHAGRFTQPGTRESRTCCAGGDTVNNKAKMSSATRRASLPQRAAIRNFADPVFGILCGVQETSGPPDAASCWHCTSD